MSTKKLLIVFLFSFVPFLSITAQDIPLQTSVYHWENNHGVNSKFGSQHQLFDGSGKILNRQILTGLSLRGGKQLVYQESVSGDELFFIIKTGMIEVQLNNQVKQLEKGSVVFLLPGEKVSFKNVHKDDAELYVMQMHSASPNIQRGRDAGSSFMMDWYDMVFKPHDKGGVRQLFDRKTVMTNRFDIHITSLNPGLSSHPAHTHLNEEIILMLDGEGVMILGDKKQEIKTGDAAWVESMIPHNITNTATRPIVYFAIQWN